MRKRRYITVEGVLRQPQRRRTAGAPFIARLALCHERDDEVVSWDWTAFVVPRRPPGGTGNAYLKWFWHYGVGNDICATASQVPLEEVPAGIDPFEHAAAVTIDSICKHRDGRFLAFTVTGWHWDTIATEGKARS